MQKEDIEILLDRENNYSDYFTECQECSDNFEINNYLLRLANINVIDIIKLMIANYSQYVITTIKSEDVFQFSNMEDSTVKLCEHLKYSGNKGYSFKEVGEMLLDRNRKKEALVKYGENQSKTAEILGLTHITNGRPRKVYLTKIGCELLNINSDNYSRIFVNLMIRASLVQFILYKASKKTVYIKEELSFLSQKTITRRLPNVKKILQYIYKHSLINLDYIYKDIDFNT